MSGVDYAALMVAVAAKLSELAPARVVTRTFKDFAQHDRADLEAGIFTVLFAGVQRYPWDRCDQHDGEGPGATALPVFAFRVLGQRVLEEGATGEQVEAAEFAMLAEIEQLADALVADATMDEHEELCRLVLKGADTSQQLEAPDCWVATLFVASID